MATIIARGCEASCDSCRTRFSFLPGEARYSAQHVPAGYSPEEEAYDKDVLTVACPHCGHPVDVTRHVGPSALRAARENHRTFRDYDD